MSVPPFAQHLVEPPTARRPRPCRPRGVKLPAPLATALINDLRRAAEAG